jgi:hypothetical protein
MSDATTGVAHANARVSTIPKLSPPSDGATSAFAVSSSAVSASWLRKPSASIPSASTLFRVRRSRTISGSAPTMRRRTPVRLRISGQARRSTAMPLRGSWRPTKTIRCSRSRGSASGGISVPFGISSYSPGNQREADSRAASVTAIRWSIRSIRKPHAGLPIEFHARLPEAWKVATTGASAQASVAVQITGVIGS